MGKEFNRKESLMLQEEEVATKDSIGQDSTFTLTPTHGNSPKPRIVKSNGGDNLLDSHAEGSGSFPFERPLTNKEQEILHHLENKQTVKKYNADLHIEAKLHGHTLGRGGLGTRADKRMLEHQHINLIKATVLYGITLEDTELSSERIADLFIAEVENMEIITHALFDAEGRNLPSNVRTWLRGKGYDSEEKDGRLRAMYLMKDLPDMPEPLASGVTNLNFSRQELTHMPKSLQYFYNLRTLKVNYCHISSLEGMPALQNLEELYLDYNELTHLKGLPPMENLRLLSLGGLGEIDFTSLSVDKFPKLRELTLKYSKVETVKRPDELLHPDCKFTHRSSMIRYK